MVDWSEPHSENVHLSRVIGRLTLRRFSRFVLKCYNATFQLISQTTKTGGKDVKETVSIIHGHRS